MRSLHEESGDKCLSNIDVVISAGEVSARSLQFKSVHDSSQLKTDIVRRLEGPATITEPQQGLEVTKVQSQPLVHHYIPVESKAPQTNQLLLKPIILSLD